MAEAEDNSSIETAEKTCRPVRRRRIRNKKIRLTQAELERNMQIILSYLNREEGHPCLMSKVAAHFCKEHNNIRTPGCVRVAVQTLKKRKLIQLTSRGNNCVLSLCMDGEEANVSTSQHVSKTSDDSISTSHSTSDKITNADKTDLPETKATPAKAQVQIVKKKAAKPVDYVSILGNNPFEKKFNKTEIARNMIKHLNEANKKCCSRQALLTTLLKQNSGHMTKAQRRVAKNVIQEAIDLLVSQERIEVCRDDARFMYKLAPASEPAAPTSAGTCSVEKVTQSKAVSIQNSGQPQRRADGKQLEIGNSKFAKRVVEHLARRSQSRCSKQQLLASILENSAGTKTSETMTSEMEKGLERVLQLLVDQACIAIYKTDSNQVLYQLNTSRAAIAPTDMQDTISDNAFPNSISSLDAHIVSRGSTAPLLTTHLPAAESGGKSSLPRDSDTVSASFSSPVQAADTANVQSLEDSEVPSIKPGTKPNLSVKSDSKRNLSVKSDSKPNLSVKPSPNPESMESSDNTEVKPSTQTESIGKVERAMAQPLINSDSKTNTSDTDGDGVVVGGNSGSVLANSNSSTNTLDAPPVPLRQRRGLEALQTSWRGKSLSVTDDYSLSGGLVDPWAWAAAVSPAALSPLIPLNGLVMEKMKLGSLMKPGLSCKHPTIGLEASTYRKSPGSDRRKSVQACHVQQNFSPEWFGITEEWRRSQTKQAVMWMEEQERQRRHAEYLPDVATEALPYSKPYIVVCPHPGCVFEGSMSDIGVHMQTCPFGNLHNDKLVPLQNSSKHPENYVVVCPNKGCEFSCPRMELAAHMLTCEKGLNGRASQSVLKQQYPVFCPNRARGCTFSGPLSLLRSSHLKECQYCSDGDISPSNTMSGETLEINYEVMCVYSSYGCKHSCMIEFLADHVKNCPFQPDLNRANENAERLERQQWAMRAVEEERRRRILAYDTRVRMSSNVSSVKLQLNREILAFAEQETAVLETQAPQEQAIVREVLATIQRLWGADATLLQFGSRAAGLSLRHSDVDLVVCRVGVVDAPMLSVTSSSIPSKPRGLSCGSSGSLLSDEDGGGTSGFADVSGGSLKTVELLRTLGDALPSDRFTTKQLIESKVAVLKVKAIAPGTDTGTAFELDISFGNDLARQNNRVRLYLQQLQLELPQLKPLVLLLKRLLAIKGLEKAYMGGLCSYALTLMVAHFLQRHSKITCLGELFIKLLQAYGQEFNPRLYCIAVEPLGSTGVGTAPIFAQVRHAHLYETLQIEDPCQAGNNPGIGCFRISQIQRVFTEVCAELLLVSVYGDRPAGGCELPEKKPRPLGDEVEAKAVESSESIESANAKTAFSLLGWATYS